MSRDWKPGDVASVLCSDGEWRRAAYFLFTFDPPAWVFPDNTRRRVQESDARPLVVIDPEGREQVEQLTKALVEAAHEHGNLPVSHNGIAGETTALALRSLLEPPKPEEPTGIGAVVEAIFDNQFVHIGDGRWQRVGSRCEDVCSFADIAAVKVLSPGVTP